MHWDIELEHNNTHYECLLSKHPLQSKKKTHLLPTNLERLESRDDIT
jgi:hypothetical protein